MFHEGIWIGPGSISSYINWSPLLSLSTHESRIEENFRWSIVIDASYLALVGLCAQPWTWWVVPSSSILIAHADAAKDLSQAARSLCVWPLGTLSYIKASARETIIWLSKCQWWTPAKRKYTKSYRFSSIIAKTHAGRQNYVNSIHGPDTVTFNIAQT